MPRSIFTAHFEMLNLYEKPTKKAKFWTSYVKSLGEGSFLSAENFYTNVKKEPRKTFPEQLARSEDIQAREKKEQHKYANPDDLRSIYDDSKTAQQRITAAGYHYTPLSRNTYGHTPRKTGQRSIYELSK